MARTMIVVWCTMPMLPWAITHSMGISQGYSPATANAVLCDFSPTVGYLSPPG